MTHNAQDQRGADVNSVQEGFSAPGRCILMLCRTAFDFQNENSLQRIEAEYKPVT